MAKELIALYGPGYTPHGDHGRLFSLMALHCITPKDAMNGQEEARAFERNQFVALHKSTLGKVDVMSNILERALDGTLKTNAHWWQARGHHPGVVIEFLKENWIACLIAFLLFSVLGAASAIKDLCF